MEYCYLLVSLNFNLCVLRKLTLSLCNWSQYSAFGMWYLIFS